MRLKLAKQHDQHNPPGNICLGCGKNLGPYCTLNRCIDCEKTYFNQQHPGWNKSRKCKGCNTFIHYDNRPAHEWVLFKYCSRECKYDTQYMHKKENIFKWCWCELL